MGETRTSRQVVLARHVQGEPLVDDFRIETVELDPPEDGEFLVRNFMISLDPGTRARLSGEASYIPPLPLGGVLGSFNLGTVIESRHDGFPVGTVVSTTTGWCELARHKGRGFCLKLDHAAPPWSPWLGALGVSGMTAWFGLHRVGGLKEGQTVVVTSAAGAVGSSAVQIARLRGARVIAVAGGPEKCAWLRDVAGAERAIDYRSEDVAAAVAAAAPDGVDILFDNVGNAMIEALLPAMAMHGRIVVSGQMDDYNRSGDRPAPGISATRRFITHRVRMEGLVVFDDLADWPDAQSCLRDWIARGDFICRDEVLDGLEQAPAGFCGLFRGENRGRRLVRIGPEPAGDGERRE